MKLLLAVLLMFSQVSLAETTIIMKGRWTVSCNGQEVSKHNTYYKALEKAINVGQNCDILPPLRYEIRKTEDPDKDEVVLSWVEPVQREDGTDMVKTEIEGYQLYSGPSPEELTVVDFVKESTITKVLPQGTYYFAVTTVTSEGLVSEFSNIVEVVL